MLKLIYLNKKQVTIKTIYYIACLLILITSCGKSSGSPDKNEEDVYVQCKVNDKLVSFDHFANGNNRPSVDKVQAVVVGGWEGNDKLKFPGFGFHLTKLDGITVGEYSTGKGHNLVGEYYYQILEDGKIKSTIVFKANGLNGTNFKLNIIISLDNWGIRGEFEGTLERDNEIMKITEGKFAVPYN